MVDVGVDVGVDADVDADVAVDVDAEASEVCSVVEMELVDVVSVVVFASLASVVLVSEKTVAVIVWCVFGRASDTESHM